MKQQDMKSVGYTAGTHTFPRNDNRQGLMIVGSADIDATIAFGDGGDAMPMGSYIEPYVTTTGSFVLTVTTGTAYVYTNDHSDVVSV